MNVKRTVVIASCFLFTMLASVGSPSSAYDEGVGRCTSSTALGEPEPARCFLFHPTCPAGFCTWPDVHVRVWVEDGTEGALTPVVTGAIHANTIVCREIGDSCQGTYEFDARFGPEVHCMGYGPEDGAVLAITEVVNAAWAVHMECWVEGY